jgi:UDP-hydrolysing UDP-N-acetyl-D-glucosamine 2-epimerase
MAPAPAPGSASTSTIPHRGLIPYSDDRTMPPPRRTIVVVTGSRAEFGLLRPVMRAIEAHEALDLRIAVTGTHLLEPALTINEVKAEFEIDAAIPMQSPGPTGRLADAAALGRGISGFADYFAKAASPPEVVLVLGDRIEAFAAAAAASVAGIRVAHMHGGDRASGLADEALRHAITKLAHIHLPATAHSAERIICMGEIPLSVHLVGSPAIDGLGDIAPLDDAAYAALGRPQIVFVFHPAGHAPEEEWANTERLLRLCKRYGSVLALHPNFDAGREAILEAIETAGCPARPHLPRAQFIGLLRRARVLVGNSSAGLIECAAIGTPSINVGPRQAGREAPDGVVSVPDGDFGAVDLALEEFFGGRPGPTSHPFGNGHAGEKTAEVLATFKPDHHPLIKLNTF